MNPVSFMRSRMSVKATRGKEFQRLAPRAQRMFLLAGRRLAARASAHAARAKTALRVMPNASPLFSHKIVTRRAIGDARRSVNGSRMSPWTGRRCWRLPKATRGPRGCSAAMARSPTRFRLHRRCARFRRITWSVRKRPSIECHGMRSRPEPRKPRVRPPSPFWRGRSRKARSYPV